MLRNEKVFLSNHHIMSTSCSLRTKKPVLVCRLTHPYTEMHHLLDAMSEILKNTFACI